MADGHHLQKKLNCHICSTDYDEIWHSDTHWPTTGARPINFKFLKIQHGSVRHRENHKKNRDISATVWQIVTKLGMMQIGSLDSPYGDAYWPPAKDRPLKFQIFENRRWRWQLSWNTGIWKFKMVASQHFKKPLITILTNKTAILYRQNWFQFLFVVKATTLKQQTSKFYPQIISTEVSFDI